MALSGVAFRLEKKEENYWQIVEKYKDVQTGTEGKLILSDLDLKCINNSISICKT
ncbi:hypothetical protein [Streptococcus pyogenes]|uniref:hypothetical protein n=1 Tax=Streptococcus pyogenes TaxID=1314 RepID=UPI0039C8A38E